MKTEKDQPITFTAEQVGALRRYYDQQFDNMNRLALLAQLLDTQEVSLDSSACIGIASILNEIAIRMIGEDTEKCPLDLLLQNHEAAA